MSLSQVQCAAEVGLGQAQGICKEDAGRKPGSLGRGRAYKEEALPLRSPEEEGHRRCCSPPECEVDVPRQVGLALVGVSHSGNGVGGPMQGPQGETRSPGRERGQVWGETGAK